ncbi:MAG: SDR family NAD(P)-dependent oxidoreductase [Candidatus Eremiobacteraeota bacterium]|nr:SDR family NAD(P)-dependent oxidoreductase [Candidatus Eremiobacteraeota bacterium]
MNVLIVGATGYIGAAVARAVASAGYRVFGTARSAEAAEKLRRNRVTPREGDVRDPVSLRAAAATADALIYAVQYGGEDAFEVESAALRALADAAAEGKKTFIYTSGVWIYGNTRGRVADEGAPQDPTPLAAKRPLLEQIVLDSTARGARAVVIRPGYVFGHGGGVPAMWSGSATSSKTVRAIGDGSNRWPVVHVEDLARLYVLALQSAPANAIYNANDETTYTVREMAEAAGRGAGAEGQVEFVPLEAARESMGAFADALVLDQRISSKRAREELGWSTSEATIVDELTNGYV